MMRPTASCATAPQRNTPVAMLPIATNEMPEPMRSSISFGSAMVMVLKTRPAVVADQDEQREHRDHYPHRQPHIGSRAASGCELAVIRHHDEIGDAGRDADHGRHQERATPADPCGQRSGDPGGERDADVAANPVEGERPAAIGRRGDNDRGATG